MAASDLYAWDHNVVTELHSQLMNTKLSQDAGTFFSNQAYVRGGIGNLVSTGSARGAINRLPQRVQGARGKSAPLRNSVSLSSSRPASMISSRGAYPRGESRPLTTGTAASSWSNSSKKWWGQLPGGGDTASLAAAAAASVVVGPRSAGVPNVAKHEWEQVVPHPYNFVSTTRQTRVTDVRPASKWATLSLYEADPKEVKRHLDIADIIEHAHSHNNTKERDIERVRHFTWAMQQREIFRRQRQEVAVRYAAAGLPERKAYSALDTSRAAESLGASDMDYHTQAMQESVTDTPSGPAVSLPKPTYAHVYQRMASEHDELLESSVEVTRRRAEENAQQTAQAEVKAQLKNMDSFEQHLQSVWRKQKLRGKTSNTGSNLLDGDDY